MERSDMSQSGSKTSTNTVVFATSTSPLLEQQLSQSPTTSNYLAPTSSKMVTVQLSSPQGTVRDGEAVTLQAPLQVIHVDAATLAALTQLGTSNEVTSYQQTFMCPTSTVITSSGEHGWSVATNTRAMLSAKDGNSNSVSERPSSSNNIVTLSQSATDVTRALNASDQTIIQIPNGVSIQQLLQSLVGSGGVQQVYMLQMNNSPNSGGLSLMTGVEKTAQTTPGEEEPFYVNAKQYKRILQRRMVRGRLESQGRIPKTRKKYLHESRHLHALNRVRGEGGRFNPGAKKGSSSKVNGEDAYSDQSDTGVSLCISEQSAEKAPHKILPKPVI